MKKFLSYLFITTLFLNGFSQREMEVKQFNFTSFHQDAKRITPLLEKKSSAEAKLHPEYGVLPFNSQCKECVEIINERTEFTRQYFDTAKGTHFATQQSFYPLHYKKAPGDMWRTIDFRLKQNESDKNIYEAANQPVPTGYDLNKHISYLTVEQLRFEYNKNLEIYFYDDDIALTKRTPANYTKYSVGEEGLNVKDIWPGINMEQVFRAGEIETNYVINKPLTLPIDKGWMVIEDHFTLPNGYTIEELPSGEHTKEGFYKGDYVIKDTKGLILIPIQKPIYVDAMAWGMHGMYRLSKDGNNYTLQILTPIDWLKKKENTYPLYIDPIVGPGQEKIGDFRSTGNGGLNMGFSTKPATCDDYFHQQASPPRTPVKVNGQSQLTQVFVDVEYELTYDNTCGNPPLPNPYCTFSQASMEVVCDQCQTTTGQLSCNPAAPPFTGTCTTDPALVPGAHALEFDNLVSCYPPQCPAYAIDFTLKNQDSICGDVCGYLCARGNMWQMTVYACSVEGNITQDKTQVCAGQPVTFTAHPDCGVPPYHYVWSYGNNTDTIYNSADLVIRPNQGVGVSCNIFDSCGGMFSTNALTVTVAPAPPADAGPDQKLCAGGTVTIGGNPTTDNNSTVAWTTDDPNAGLWISNATATNPTVTVPAGTVDTFYYVVTATNPNLGNCTRTDTVYVFSGADPQPVIDSGGPTKFCAGGSVTLSVEGNYKSYLWSNTTTSHSTNVGNAGSYLVTVTDANGCTGSSNTITVSLISIPPFSVFPDTTILYGDSIMLTTDADLSSSSIDGFTWYPNINISCLKCDNPTVGPLTDQYYGLVINEGGCSASDSALIKIIYPNNFFIPNGFTPNGDGNNDNFYIQSQTGVHVLSFQVFDRWGELVHDGPSPWDGYYKGKLVPEGVYTYVFKLTTFGNDQPFFRKGSVTLLR